MIPLEVEQWLSRIRTPFTEIRRRVDQAVRILCDRNGYAYSSRVKDSQSLAEKLETGRVQNLEHIDDLFACAIIVPSLSHEDSILERLHQIFTVHEMKKRGTTNKPPDVFRFDASRFIGRLRLSETDDPRLGLVPFEVQVRTAFEHAWSVATHPSAYKGERIDWKLERLAAQMKALVEQLDSLAVAYDQSADLLIEHPYRTTGCESRVFTGFQKFVADGLIPDECQPQRWGLFAKNIVALASAANWGRAVSRIEDRIELLLVTVESYLRDGGIAQFPMSLSAYQMTIGVLVQHKIIQPKLDSRYFPPISNALEVLFAETKKVQPRCVFHVEVADEP